VKIKDKSLKKPEGNKLVKKTSNIIIITIAVLTTIISMANLQPVTINLLFFSIDIPLILLIFLILATGFVTGYILKGIIDYRKYR